ncbi:MAG: hypothetical protein K0S07_1653 [Chlamydiales bacterium]|jgi:hypothetical protein|nr:hypothetical protein [Chlamydiales bacterium]
MQKKTMSALVCVSTALIAAFIAFNLVPAEGETQDYESQPISQLVDAKSVQYMGSAKIEIHTDSSQAMKSNSEARAKDYEKAYQRLKEKADGEVYLVVRGGFRIEDVTGIEALPNETLIIVYYGIGQQSQSRVLKVEDIDAFGQQPARSRTVRIIGR